MINLRSLPSSSREIPLWKFNFRKFPEIADSPFHISLRAHSRFGRPVVLLGGFLGRCGHSAGLADVADVADVEDFIGFEGPGRLADLAGVEDLVSFALAPGSVGHRHLDSRKFALEAL